MLLAQICSYRVPFLDMNKFVVIGSNSFSGAHFVDLLLENKNNDVIGIDRQEKGPLFLPYLRHNSNLFHYYNYDLNTDTDAIAKLIIDAKPDYIVNFAALSEVAPSWKHPDQWYQTNVVALTRLINQIKTLPSIKKYTHISSPEVYGTCEGVVTEENPMNPTTPYAASKAAADFSLMTFYKNFNFPLVLMRATNVYGEHQQLFKIIPRTMIYVKMGRKIPLHGGGVAVKSYIHIKDISRGYLAGALLGRPGEIYHLSPDKGVAVRDVVSTIATQMGTTFENVVDVVEERLGQDKAYVIDSSKARREFGWYPVITMEQGLQRTVDWVESYWDQIQVQPLEYIHLP